MLNVGWDITISHSWFPPSLDNFIQNSCSHAISGTLSWTLKDIPCHNESNLGPAGFPQSSTILTWILVQIFNVYSRKNYDNISQRART